MVDESRANGDQERARHATAAARFFIDRLVRREPKLDLTRAMAELASEIGHQSMSDYEPGCIEERKRSLEAIMQDSGKK